MILQNNIESALGKDSRVILSLKNLDGGNRDIKYKFSKKWERL